MDIIENRDAQFMLLAGFIIAVGLVITTMLLNSIAFEGNMAGEAGSDPVKYDIANLMQVTADEVKSAYRNATAVGGNDVNFSKQMRNFNGNVSKIYALRGEGINVSWDVRNWNNTRYANFTDNGIASGASNWTVIQNVSSSNITVNVTSGIFYINITNATSYWQINFTDSNPQNRTITSTQISTNVTSLYTISFINGTNASGRFNITGTASGRSFIRARDYILNTTLTLSTSRVRVNLTIPVSVPW